VETKELLLHEIEGAPEPLLAEVVDFIRFLKRQKAQEHLETALLTEASLAKDWLKPEEEAAWRDL
jgi:hypothetical protein